MDWIHLSQDRDYVAGFCEHGNEPPGAFRMQGISWVVDQQLVKADCGVQSVVGFCRPRACSSKLGFLREAVRSAKGPHCAGWGPEAVPPPLEICAYESEKSVAVRQSRQSVSQLVAAVPAQDVLCVAPSGGTVGCDSCLNPLSLRLLCAPNVLTFLEATYT